MSYDRQDRSPSVTLFSLVFVAVGLATLAVAGTARILLVRRRRSHLLSTFETRSSRGNPQNAYAAYDSWGLGRLQIGREYTGGVRREREKEKEKPKIYEVLGEKEGGTGDWDHWEGSPISLTLHKNPDPAEPKPSSTSSSPVSTTIASSSTNPSSQPSSSSELSTHFFASVLILLPSAPTKIASEREGTGEGEEDDLPELELGVVDIEVPGWKA